MASYAFLLACFGDTVVQDTKSRDFSNKNEGHGFESLLVQAKLASLRGHG